MWKTNFLKLLTIAVGAVAVLVTSPGESVADRMLLKSVSPGSPHNTVHTVLATVVKKHTKHEIQVSLGTTPPKAQLDVATGKAQLAFSAPTITWFMKRGVAMYAKVPNAKELHGRLRSIVSHGGGLYTFVVRADSGIKTLKDLKGKRLSMSIPGGAANRVFVAVIKGATGYEPGKDYRMSRLTNQAAIQAFQDGQVDLWGIPAAQPNPVIEQFALTNKIRLLDVPESAFSTPEVKRVLEFPGRSRGEIAPDMYGENQVNTKPVKTLGTTVAIVTSDAVNADAIYDITKAMWENIQDFWAAGSYMKGILNKEVAFFEMDAPLHVGALRYYREAGFRVPDHLIPPEAK